MTALQFIRDPKFGCCNTSELMALNKEDNAGYKKLMQWAREEMINRGIPVEEATPKIG